MRSFRLGQAQVRSSPASSETAKAAPPNVIRADDRRIIPCEGDTSSRRAQPGCMPQRPPEETLTP
jgi:hypothetical protein